MMRVDGDICPISASVLEPEPLVKMLSAFPIEKSVERDFALEIPNLGRFRVHVFTHARGLGAVLRVIPTHIASLEDLHLPPILKDIASFPKGLVLVTGPTGSGKSTTLAALMEYINLTQQKHIITIEDPIEFVYTSKKCLIHQREVQRDTQSFQAALKAALREDPDVILVGELRDGDSMRLAMSASETGHLVFATLHTNSATKTIHRIIDGFPGDEKSRMLSLLSESLQAVIAQKLLKKIGGGRIAAVELLFCNTAIRHLIREDKISQMISVMQTGQSQGMQTFEQHVKQLVMSGVIHAREV
jgi:twitching motility protein PilT